MPVQSGVYLLNLNIVREGNENRRMITNHAVNPELLEFLIEGLIPGQVVGGACRGECPRQGEDNHLLACKQILGGHVLPTEWVGPGQFLLFKKKSTKY